MQERIVSAKPRSEDTNAEATLRPRALEEYVGQEEVKDNLRISVLAARKREEPLDHVLLYGPPGLGKTTLANIIAAEMGVNIRITSGPAVERPGDMAAILTNLKKHDVLFIDEIHRLSRGVEEILYPALEDFALDIVIGKGPTARSIRLKIPPFTLVGATTRYAMLSAPLRDRFGAVYRLDFYSPEAIEHIVSRSTAIFGLSAHPDAIAEIAARSRGTPRVANRLLKRVRDYAQVMGDGTLNAAISREALDRMQVDRRGLGQDGPPRPRRRDRPFRGRAGRHRDPRDLPQRGGGHDHGRLRALPHPTRLHPTHAQGAHRHAPRLRVPRAALPRIGRPLEPAEPFRGVAVALWASAHLSARPVSVPPWLRGNSNGKLRYSWAVGSKEMKACSR